MRDSLQPSDPQFMSGHSTPSIKHADHLALLLAEWKPLSMSVVGGAALAIGLSFAIAPTFTARTVIITPQPQQNAAASALASLSALSGLSGLSGVKTPADQYVSLMQSISVSNHLIEQFDLMQVYESKLRIDAQKELASNVRISAGKKDNLITIEVDDHDPKRAADMANAYVEELRSMANGLALSEAQLRRKFFEKHLQATRDELKNAQVALQKTGLNAGAIKNEPKAAADNYAKLRAEVAGAEIKQSVMRRSLADNAPELQQQSALVAGLRGQLTKLESPLEGSANSTQDYISAYRDFKYQETLFDIFARQYELARLDESREGTLIQVLDAAMPPERKSKPKRSTLALAGAVLGFMMYGAFILSRRGKAALHRRSAGG